MKIRIVIDYDAVEDPVMARPKEKMLADVLSELATELGRRELHQWDSGDVRLPYGETIGHWNVE